MSDKFTIDFLYSQIKIMDKYEEALCNHSIPDKKTKEQCWEDFKVGQAAATQNYADALYEIQDLQNRIAELEARLESCESALASMVYQFFYQPELGVLAHSFMSAEEEACEYLIKYGIAHWSNERKNSIVFDEVQELPKESEE